MVAMNSEVRASSIVTGRRSVSISVTGRPKRIESPRSPVTHAAHVDAKLDRDRLVQPVALHKRVADLVGGLFAQHGAAGVARNQAGEQEGHKEDAEQDGMASTRRRRM